MAFFKEKRIGVFLCRCGNNIGGVIDISSLAEDIKSISGVVYVEDNYYSCSEEGLTSIKREIIEQKLNRVVVAACTPRTHEWLFQKACEEAGLNKYLFEFVNIREQCSWIHSTEKKKANEKAKALIEMGISKTGFLKPMEDIKGSVIPSILIVGGGIAGITAALNLANQGIKVYVIEKNEKLGGLLNNINKVYQNDNSILEFIENKIAEISGNKNITVYLKSTINEVSGYTGNFEITIQNKDKQKKIRAGGIIVATGARELQPFGLYRYNEIEGVVTQLELEDLQKRDDFDAKDVVMINCVGARGKENTYCGKFCCITSLKNALYIKERSPETNVFILYRDMMAVGKELEIYYKKSRAQGIHFIKYSPEKPPEIQGIKKITGVKVYNEFTGKEITLPADWVILTTPLIPGEDNKDLSQKLKVPLMSDGFFLEAHQKLRPVEFANDGIYLCGTARYPANITDSVTQAYAAASKASIPIERGFVEVPAFTAICNEILCSGCGNCIAVCPFEAIDFEETQNGRQKTKIIEIKCRSCGLCVSVCPNGALQQNGFSDKQLLSMIEIMRA